MSESQPASVKSSLPWWLWAMLVVATVAIGAGVISSSVPPDPAAIYEQAKTEMRAKEIEKFSSTVDKLRKYPEYSSHVNFLDGLKAMAQKRQPRALELFERAAENEELLSDVLPEIGACHTQMGEYKDAIKAYERAIEVSPEDATRSRILLSRLYYMIGAKGSAAEVVGVVIENDPKNANARMLLATCQQDYNKYREALEHLLPILSTPGDFATASPTLLSQYAKLLIAVDDQERLSEFVEKYAEVVTESELKGGLSLAIGNFSEARQGLQEEIKGGMASPETKLVYARLEMEEGGDLAKAKPILDESLLYRPRNMDTWEALKRYYEILEDAEKVAVAEENIQQLGVLTEDLMKAYDNVGDDVESVDKRIEVMKALLRVGRYTDAQQWGNIVRALKPSIDPRQLMDDELKTLKVLVPFPDTKEADTKEADTKEADTKEADTKEADTKEADTKEADTKEADTKEADTKEADTKEADTKEADTKEADTKEADTKEADTKEADTKEADTKEADTKEADTKEADTKEADTKEADTKEADTKEADTKEADTKEADTKEADTKEADTKEAD